MFKILEILPKTAVQRTLLATIVMMTSLGGAIVPAIQPARATQTTTQTSSSSTFSSYSQDHWQTTVHMAKLTSRNQLVLQVNIQDKPATTYANAVYSLYAYQNSQWVQVYTNTGARLIANASNQVTLAPEVIDCDKVRRDSGIDIQSTELKAIVSLRYDNQMGRDQMVQFEQRHHYSQIAEATSTQIIQSVTQIASSNNLQSSGFSLAITQNTRKNKDVIARVSLKQSNSQGFSAERYLGDFRYKLHHKKQQINFINGVKAGDRVVVRLFDKKDRFIGYSEFEVQARNAAATLVIGDQDESLGVVRTIYGIDADRNGQIDSRTTVYDYFTQVTETKSWQDAQVAFLSSSQGIDLRDFTIDNLPRPTISCNLPDSFTRGQYSLVNQVFYAFTQNLTNAITTFPSQMTQIFEVSTMTIETYEVSQLLMTLNSIASDNSVVYQEVRSSKAKYKKPKYSSKKQKHCNQGRGNGSEGCDPGQSRPHGGSNDGDD